MAEHPRAQKADVAPGDEHGEADEVTGGISGYLIGLALASAMTVVSFAMPDSPWIWQPAIPVALIALAIAQMGIHLVFFLHITTGPDNTNNAMALAFGLLIVALLIGGSVWIMSHLNHNMMPAHPSMGM